jgi:hypothetical protein
MGHHAALQVRREVASPDVVVVTVDFTHAVVDPWSPVTVTVVQEGGVVATGTGMVPGPVQGATHFTGTVDVTATLQDPSKPFTEDGDMTVTIQLTETWSTPLWTDPAARAVSSQGARPSNAGRSSVWKTKWP